MVRIDIRSIRRKQIIEAAEELAAQRGWAETTIVDICHQARVSSGVLTYHFADKDDIMFAALEDVLDRLHHKFFPPDMSELTREGSIDRFMRILVEVGDTEPQLYRLLLHFIVASIQRPEIAPRICTLFNSMRQKQVAAFASFRSSETAATHDPLVFVSILHSFALGIMMNRAFLNIDMPSRQLAEEARNMFQLYVETYFMVPARSTTHIHVELE